MREFIFVLLILALSPLGVGAQQSTDKLVLTGSVVGVSCMTETSSGQDVYSFNVRLYLQLHNKSDEPLIVFRPDRFMGQRKVEFLKNDTSAAGFKLGTSETLPWWNPFPKDDYDPFPRYIESIKVSPEPIKDGFVTIEPGSYFEYGNTLTVSVGYKPDTKNSEAHRKWAAQYHITSFGCGQPTSEFPALRIEYYLSLKKHQEEADFLRTVQKRWKRFGNLYLNSNGDFQLNSLPILNQTGPTN